MTRKLYYEDSHIKQFTATVLSCTEGKDRWEVVLDQTAFFPGGGGQLPDTGAMNMARVIGAKEDGEDVVHYVTAPMTLLLWTTAASSQRGRSMISSGSAIWRLRPMCP